jgi:hypothetical protein
MKSYEPAFSEAVLEYLLSSPKNRQRKALQLADQLAENPHILSDYTIADSSGRLVEHLLIETFVFAYWVDHPVGEIRIVDIEDAQ